MGEGGRPLNQAATAMLSNLSGIRSATMATARGVEALGREMALLRQAMQSRANPQQQARPRQPAQRATPDIPAGTPTRSNTTPGLPLPPGPAGAQPARQDANSAPLPASEPAVANAPMPASEPAVAQRPRSAARVAQANSQARGQGGRFVSAAKDGAESAATATPSSKDDPSATSPLTSAANRMADAAKAMTQEATSGADQVDPTVQAMKEVAAPVARGWQAWGEFRGKDKDPGSKAQEGLLKRIMARLGAMKKSADKASTDASKASAQTNKHLENLENKPTGGGESGGFFDILTKILASISVLGSLLGSLFAGAAAGRAGGGLLSRLFGLGKPPASGAAGAAGAAGTAAAEAGAAGRAGGIGSKLLGAGGKVLRKIPLIGGLIAAIGTAMEVSDIEGDDQLSRREKDQRSGKSVGGLGGMLAGGAAGAKIGALAGAAFGPLGAAIGGALGGAVGMFLGDQAGQIIGDKLGSWVNDLRQYDIPGKLTEAWDGTVKWVKDSWSKGIDAFTAIPDKIASTWDAFVKGVSDKFGIELPKAAEVTKAVETKLEQANELARETRKGMQTAAGKAVETGKEVAGKAVETGKVAVDKTVAVAKEGGKWVAENTTPGKVAVAAGRGAANAAERAYNVSASTAGSVLENVMPKGYRHKALFDGIKGGDKLTEEGRYTDEEAAKIRELKGSGANTSANGRGGMSLEIQDKIAAQAKKAGLDPVMMQKIAAMESGGNANAISDTGAIGIYQFTGATASGVGIKNRFDVDQNIEGGMKLTKQNQAYLKKAGLPVTAENLYMMHQLGPSAAKEVIKGAAEGKMKSDLSSATQSAMNKNYGKNSRTAADYISTNKKALDDRYALVTGKSAKSAVASAVSPPVASGVTPSSAVASPPPVPSPVAASPTVSTPPAPSAPPKMASTVTVPDAKVEPPAPVAVAASSGGASGMAAQGVSQHLSNPTIAHIVTGGIGFRG